MSHVSRAPRPVWLVAAVWAVQTECTFLGTEVKGVGLAVRQSDGFSPMFFPLLTALQCSRSCWEGPRGALGAVRCFLAAPWVPLWTGHVLGQDSARAFGPPGGEWELGRGQGQLGLQGEGPGAHEAWGWAGGPHNGRWS